jgi:hypothetical protein
MKNARRGNGADTATAEISFFIFDSSMLESRDIAAHIYCLAWSVFFEIRRKKGGNHWKCAVSTERAARTHPTVGLCVTF